MIATSSPNTKAVKAPYANPSVLPTGSIHDYVIQSGQFRGMTVDQVRQYAQTYNNSIQEFNGTKPQKNQQSQQALGLLGGLGATAAIGGIVKNGLPSLPSWLGGASSVGSSSVGASTAGTSSGLGSMQLAGTLGTEGAADLSVGGAAGAGSTGTAGAGIGGAVLPALGIAAGAYTGYQQGKGLYDAAKGKDLSFQQQAALALPTFGASFAYNPIKKFFGSSKAPERDARKQIRGSAQSAGLISPDSKSIYSLADGSGFDIRDYKKNTGKDAYNVDFSNPSADQNVKIGAVNALAAALSGKSGKAQSDIAGELYNAYNSSGDFWGNIKSAADKGGGVSKFSQSIQGSKINDADKAAFMSGLDSIYNTNSRNTILASQAPAKKVEAAKPSTSPASTKPQVQVKKPINPRLKGKR